MWGWTDPLGGTPDTGLLSPTRVGMDLNLRERLQAQPPKPHACGDGPQAPLTAEEQLD